MFCIAIIFDVSAQLGRLLTSRPSSRLINKSSTKSRTIEHTSNEILTFCTHVGEDISTPVLLVDLRFHYSIAKCQYFVILVAFDADVLRIATPAGNPVAWALQEIPLPGPGKKFHCLGPARRNSQHHLMT